MVEQLPTDDEKIGATKPLLFFGTLIISIWIALGTASCWMLNPLLGWFFLGFSAFIVLIIIRRLLCNNCYYCKSCTKGFAKLSKLSLGSNLIPGISKGSTIGMATTMYIVLTAIPGLLLANSIINAFDLPKLLLLSSLLSITTYTAIMRLKKGNNQ